MAIGEQVERDLEIDFDDFPSGLDGSEPAFNDFQLAADALLFALEQVQRDGIGVVRLQQPGTFGGQPLLLILQLADL